MFALCLCGGEYKQIINLPLSLMAGKYGSEIRPAFWLNFLFLLMPVWGAVSLFSKPKDRPLIGGYNVSQTHDWLDLGMILERFKEVLFAEHI